MSPHEHLVAGQFPLLADDGEHPELTHWVRNVGPPVALDLAQPTADPVEIIDVVSWNCAIGAGDLERVVAELRARGVGTDPGRPLVILAQEAFRMGEEVPELPFSGHHGGKAGLAGRMDVVRAARDLGLSLRYAPSMRNGASRSDRGNAILSTAPLGESYGFQLPHVRQRRVAVSATLHAVPDLLLASAHLDTRGAPRGARRIRFGAGRVVQAAGLAQRLASLHEHRTIVLGADLNTYLGDRDPALEALRIAGFGPLPRGDWSFTITGAIRLLLDHLLIRPGHQDVTVSAIVERLHDPSSGRRVFGSDHYPIFTRLDLAA